MRLKLDNLVKKSTPKGTLSTWISQHWHGENYLLYAFWVNTVIFNFAFTVFWAILAAVASGMGLVASALVLIGVWCFIATAGVWQQVGLWRTAIKSRSRIVTAVVCTWVACVAAAFSAYLFSFGLRQLREACIIISGDYEIQNWSVTVLPGGSDLAFSGGIKSGAAAALENALVLAPHIKRLVIETSGGRVSEAVAMAESVSKRGLSTYVEGLCEGAGILVFAAGSRRVVSESARIGFRRPYSAGLFDSADFGTISDRLRAAGIESRFIKSALSQEEPWYPSMPELLNARVAHEVVFRSATSDLSKTPKSTLNPPGASSAVEQKRESGRAPGVRKQPASAEVTSANNLGIEAGQGIEVADADSLFELGMAHLLGLDVAKDEGAAVRWFRAAAARGNVNAIFALGSCYEKGLGIDNDEEEAVKWYEKAAAQGHSAAQFNLGLCYSNGRGVPRDWTSAAYWYRKAADLGEIRAQFNLAHLYANGTGVAKDTNAAIHWLRRAAELGSAEAQYNLGLYYAKGTEVTKDMIEAYALFSLASGSSADARSGVELLERILSASEMDSGRRRTHELRRVVESSLRSPAYGR